VWKNDALSQLQGMSKAQFESITLAAERHYDKVASAAGERFVLIRNWNDDTVNAFCARNGNTVEVSVFGGLARQPEISPEGFALILCHEINHAFGGEPYIDVENRISAEGQADFKAPQECFRAIFPALGFYAFRMTDSILGLVAALCLEVPRSERTLCHAALMGGVSVARLSAKIRKEPEPRYDTPDQTVVPETLLRYPKSTQCRLDSLRAGFFRENRPTCWYAPNASSR
jgi:hypothetical protein